MSNEVINIISFVGAAIITIVSVICSIITDIRRIKADKSYKKEIVKLDNEHILKTKAEDLVQEVESTYEDLNKLLKGQGKTAGSLKKESVMNKLQAYASTLGISFDNDKWSKEIDKIVEFTKNINYPKSETDNKNVANDNLY